MVSFLFIVCVLVVLAFACVLTLLLLLSSRKSSVCLDHEHSFEIVKFVEAIREIFPLSSSRGWTLLSSHYGLRCWKKQFTFPILGSYTTIYGTSIKIPASAVAVLNVIADVSTWSEWNSLAQENSLHLEISDDLELQGDYYMQSDNLVSSVPGSSSKPNILMHRFGNLENNGVGWILIWHINQYNWYFYVAQPVETYLGDKPRHCLLTAVHGSDPFASKKDDLPQQLAANLQNLREAIAMSTVQIRPFMPLVSSPSSSTLNNPHLPTVHSALSDLPDVPCVLLHLEDSKEQSTRSQRNSVLAVVPFSFSKPVSLNNLVGFVLESHLLKKLDSRERLKKNSLQPPWAESRTRGRFRMGSDSLTSQEEGDKVTFVRKRSASIGETATGTPPAVTITKPAEEGSTSSLPQQSSHSFLDVIFHRRKSSDSPSKRSRSPSPLRRFGRNVKKTLTPTSSHEDLSKHVSESASTKLNNEDKLEAAGGDDYDKTATGSRLSVELNDFSESESSKEITHFNRKGSGEPEDRNAVGNYSVSALLAEMVRACVIDIHSPEEEQRKATGGWLFQDMQKDIILLKKITNIGSVTIISYLSKGAIPASPSIVWNTLCNPLTRFMYDDTVKKISVLQEFPNGQKIVHGYHESLTLLKKEIQDFCLLQTARQEEEQMVVAFHSIDCDSCPPSKEVIRGTMLPSGWIVQPEVENHNMSIVTYLLQLIVTNPESQLIEEMGNSQPQCIQNLSAYLASKPLY